jgi:hypothetical protein
MRDEPCLARPAKSEIYTHCAFARSSLTHVDSFRPARWLRLGSCSLIREHTSVRHPSALYFLKKCHKQYNRCNTNVLAFSLADLQYIRQKLKLIYMASFCDKRVVAGDRAALSKTRCPLRLDKVQQADYGNSVKRYHKRHLLSQKPRCHYRILISTGPAMPASRGIW